MKFWYCGKTGDVKSEWLKRKRDRSKNDKSRKDKKDKALVAVTKKDEQPTELALTAPQKAFIGSGASVHMMKDVSVITSKAVPSDSGTGTAVKDTIKATAQSEIVTRLTGRKKQIILNRFLYVPNVEHGLVSVLSLCTD